MKWGLWILILIVQSNPFEIKHSIKSKFTQIEVDEQNHIYGISKKGGIYKLNQKGDTLNSFEDRNLVTTHLDVQNPLRIMAFDERQNTVIFLDKTLTPQSESLSLTSVNIYNVSGIAVSRDNNTWIFDPITQELKKFNTNWQEISNSGPINSIIGENFDPFLIHEIVDRVYVADKNKGILIFDFFGNFIRKSSTLVQSDFQLLNNQLFYIQNDSLFVEDQMLFETKKIKLPNQEIMDFHISSNQLILQSAENIKIYQINL